MLTFRSTFYLGLLIVGASTNALAQVAPNCPGDSPNALAQVAPNYPFWFGNVGVEDGRFFVEEYYLVNEPVEATYTVGVRVTKQLPDKSLVTEMVMEQRTGTVMRPVEQTRLIPVADEMISFSTVAGKRVTDLEGIRKLLQKETRPAVIKFDPNPVGERYQNSLNSKLVVVHLHPQVKDVNLYIGRGHELFNNKEYAKAFAEFDLAARIDPLNPQPWNNKAWRLATWPDETIRDGKAAVAAAKKAVDLVDSSNCHPSGDGERAFVHRTLAAAYAAAGDFDQATTTVEAAIKLLPPEQKDLEDEFRRYQALFKSKQVVIDDPSGMARIVMDSTGTNAFQADFVKLEGDNVTLKKLDGTDVELPLSKLSESDQKWARDAAGTAKLGLQGYFYMTTKSGEGQGLVLDSAPLELQKRGNSSGMLWKATPTANGYFLLTTQLLEERQQVLEGGNPNAGSSLMMPNNGYTGTSWKATSDGDGYFTLTCMSMINEKLDKVLYCEPDSAPRLATGGSDDSKWKFLPVE